MHSVVNYWLDFRHKRTATTNNRWVGLVHQRPITETLRFRVGGGRPTWLIGSVIFES